MSSAPLASQDQMARASVPMSDTDIANMLTWSNEQVCHWLQSVGLGDKFEKHFVAHEITGDVLPLLQLAELKDMGIEIVGPRTKLLRNLTKLKRGYVNYQRNRALWEGEEERYDSPLGCACSSVLSMGLQKKALVFPDD